jgi:hypothetical protein
MLNEIHPIWLIVIGGLLLVFAVISSFFMVARIVYPTFVLVFITYSASFVGLMIGIIGVARFNRWGSR